MNRFKELAVRKGKGCIDKRGTNGQRNNSAALEQAPGSPSKDTRNNIFELFCRYGQGGLACCDLWGRKESDMTERLN